MKNIRYIALAFACCLLAGCMDKDWDNPDNTDVFGNNELAETNVITIDSLKTKYAKRISVSNAYEQVTESLQIKGRVTGNDIGGNIYNEVAIDDGTGAILVCISQGGLFGYLPVGQEILIELNGLYIGNYGKQPEIGTPYTNSSGTTYVSRMSRALWNEHFKLLGTADASLVQPVEFDLSKSKDETYMADNCGKLMTVKGVTIKDANGERTFAPDDGSVTLLANCANRALKNYSNIVVRTSTYADFAAMVMPTGSVDITGIFTRYSSGSNNTWQILLRTEDDITASNN